MGGTPASKSEVIPAADAFGSHESSSAALVSDVVAEARDGVLGFPGDPGDLERLAVGPQTVAVNGEEEAGPVGQNPVEVGAGGPLGAEHVDTPAESTHRAVRMVRGVLLDGGQRILARRHLKVGAGGEERPEEGMDVALDET